MPEIDDVFVIIIPTTKINFRTQANGDSLTISNMELTQAEAASLAWLINNNHNLKVKIKVDGS